MFQGSMVALVTPMHEDGSIDKKSLQQLVDWHIASHTDALIIAGTTGENATLSPDEQLELISDVIAWVKGKVPVIAGTGSNSTSSTLKMTKKAQEIGASAALVVTPYYNKPTQKGLYQHYKALAEAVSLPIILYNVPSRTSCDLLPETVKELSAFKTIIGIKEATGKLERGQEIRALCDQDFLIYSGDDPSALELMRHSGARGVISVTANIAPVKMQQMCAAALSGDYSLAEKINQELSALHKDLCIETNPIPSKWALYTLGKIQNGIRLPLLPLDKRYHDKVKIAMQNAGVK